MATEDFEEVLRFWFPRHMSNDHAVMVRQFEWWFRGGADSAISERFSLYLEHATRGDFNHWSCDPESRLALIIILDQFSRSLYRGTAQPFAQDRKALALALEGIAMRIGNSTALFSCIGLYVRNADRSIDPVGAQIVAHHSG